MNTIAETSTYDQSTPDDDEPSPEVRRAEAMRVTSASEIPSFWAELDRALTLDTGDDAPPIEILRVSHADQIPDGCAALDRMLGIDAVPGIRRRERERRQTRKWVRQWHSAHRPGPRLSKRLRAPRRTARRRPRRIVRATRAGPDGEPPQPEVNRASAEVSS